MKKRKVNKFFDLNKQTVANLTHFEQEKLLGGGVERCEETVCVFSHSAVLFSSSEYVNTQTNVIPADTRYWPCFVVTNTIK